MNLIKNNASFLIVLIGLPASGKTTFARTLEKELAKKHQNLLYIDMDIIRAQCFGDCFLPENEENVRNSAKKELLLINKSPIFVIIDDMNYYASMRHEFYEIAQKRKWIYMSIFISTPLSVCLEWNEMRKNAINPEILNRTAARLDIPGRKYKWDLPALEFNLKTIEIPAAIKKTLSLIEKKNDKSKKSKAIEQTLNPVKSKKIELDKDARHLMGLIIQNQISKEESQIIMKKLNGNVELENNAIFHRRLLKTRKNFVDWLLKNQIYQVSIDIFLTFLNERD